MGADFRGDPASAMLEVLDPAQNDSFRDHYLDLEFDLSDVLFIATANILDTIPGPLLDRMETIELAGYTLEEKRHIARRYLVPRQIEANGLKPSQIEFADAGADRDHRGVHPRGRRPQPRAPDRHRLPQSRPRGRRGQGQGQGQDLRQESARAARPPPRLRRAAPPHQGPRRRHRPRLDADRRRRPLHRGDRDAGLGQADDHRPARRRDEGVGAGGALLRARPLARDRPEARARTGSPSTTSTSTCPAGAVPKDGPSAGVAMTVALSSLISGRPVRNDVAMTGEVTLTGQVLPIGGLKEKSLAAQRAGIKRVIVPGAQRGRRRRDPRARARRARVRLRRRGLQGARRRPLLAAMEAASSRQGRPCDLRAVGRARRPGPARAPSGSSPG